MSEEIIGLDAKPARERFVGEAQPELAIEVENRQLDAVGHQPQAMLALAGLELEPLQIVDVAVRRQKSAHRAVGAAIGVIVDANPDRRLPRYRKLPYETCALAGQSSFDVSLVELVDIVAPDVEHGMADDLIFALGDAVEERQVDEPVTLLTIHIGERQAERVQLALRKRRQRLDLRVVQHFLDGRDVDACQRPDDGH